MFDNLVCVRDCCEALNITRHPFSDRIPLLDFFQNRCNSEGHSRTSRGDEETEIISRAEHMDTWYH